MILSITNNIFGARQTAHRIVVVLYMSNKLQTLFQ